MNKLSAKQPSPVSILNTTCKTKHFAPGNSLIGILLIICFTACVSSTDRDYDALKQQAGSILQEKDSTSVRRIELTIQDIENYLRSQPEEKKQVEMTQYLDTLYQKLDTYRMHTYASRFANLATAASPDLIRFMSGLRAIEDELSEGSGAKMVERQQAAVKMLNELKQLTQEVRSMQQFFAQDFPPTLEAYNYLVGFHSPAYENSKYESVRRSWKLIADQHRTKIAERELTLKSKNIVQYLKSDAEAIAGTLYKGYVVDRGRPTETVSIGRITDHAIYEGRECEGTFRVYLKRSFLGWNKGWTQLTVKGVIRVTLNEKNEKSAVEYTREEFRVEGSEM